MTGPSGHPAHPTEPDPIPEPGPPQPVPPAEPVPAPEPPHAAAPGEQAAGADFIDAPPAAAEPSFPPPAAFSDDTALIPVVSDQTQQIPAVRADDTAQIPAARQERPEPAPESVWHQPPPTEPFHAKHEKPGEWQYDPPEHLAFEHSPPAEVQHPSLIGAAAVPAPQLQPWQVPLKAEDGDRRRRNGLWISVALTTTLLLCGGGAASAYVLLRDNDASGAADPASAVDDFLTAVYTRQDPAAAGELVCREARDADKLSAKVEQIRGYAAEYEAPTFRWNTPAVDGQTEERATVSVQVTMSTEDEKTAQQQLTFTTVHKTGWLVCEIAG